MGVVIESCANVSILLQVDHNHVAVTGIWREALILSGHNVSVILVVLYVACYSTIIEMFRLEHQTKTLKYLEIK